MPDSQESPYDFADPTPPPPRHPKPAALPKSPSASPAANLPTPPGSTPRPPGKSAPAPAAPEQPNAPTHFCPYCGFTFQGASKARCPECAATTNSPTDLLQFANPRWVRTTSLGFLLLALAIACHVAGCLFRWFGTEEAKGVSQKTGTFTKIYQNIQSCI